MKEKLITLTTAVPADIYEKINEDAKALGVTRAEVARTLLIGIFHLDEQANIVSPSQTVDSLIKDTEEKCDVIDKAASAFVEGLSQIDEVPFDVVNKAAHYNQCPAVCKEGHSIECIDVVKHFGFSLGNAIKYIWRAEFKQDAILDLEKAEYYVKCESDKRAKANPADTSLSGLEEAVKLLQQEIKQRKALNSSSTEQEPPKKSPQSSNQPGIWYRHVKYTRSEFAAHINAPYKSVCKLLNKGFTTEDVAAKYLSSKAS